MQMQYRRLGRSNLRVSAVGFGTCQLRRVPEQQALDTLRRGFELGVNVVHTAPDYEGADDLVAQAVEESGRDVLILSQGYGDAAHFEWLFESACRKFKKRRLEMFGIACVDDREYLGERVWGAGGMIEFLQRKKEEGLLGAIFCTTHGSPEYLARLVTSNCFDAIMLAYNSLGFHLLSYHPHASRAYEDIHRNKTEIFPLAARHEVGLMIMKPLAGGLLCESKSFPPGASFASAPPKLTAAEVLRAILQHPGLVSAMRPFDEIYRQPTAASPLAEVVERLASAAPADRAAIDLGHYRALQPPWNDWGHVVARGRHWATVLARVVLEADQQ